MGNAGAACSRSDPERAALASPSPYSSNPEYIIIAHQFPSPLGPGLSPLGVPTPAGARPGVDS